MSPATFGVRRAFSICREILPQRLVTSIARREDAMSITVEFDDREVLDVLRRVMERFTPAGMRPAMKEIG